MPTVIDSLVLELGLDPAKFTEGQKKAMDSLRKMQEEVEKGGKNVESHGKKIEDYFSSIKRGAVSTLAAFFGARGAVEFVQNITTMDAAVGRLSKTTNMSAAEVSAWQGVAKRTGADVGSMAGTVQSLTDQLQNLALGIGNPAFLGPLRALGVDTKNANGQFKTASELLLDINKAVQGMDPARARAMMLALGIPSDVINTLLVTDKTLKSLLQEQKQIGVTQDQNARSAQELATAWHGTTQAAESYGRSLLERLKPALIQVLEWSRKLFKGAEDHGNETKKSWEQRDYEMRTKLGLPVYTGYKPPAPSAEPKGSEMSTPEQEAYIRAAALKRGIDPDIAVRVARSEGLGGAYQSLVRRRDGSREESYGPFQLFMGGGLGNKFQKDTGLDPRDPSTVRQQIDFSLDEAVKSGWGAWHGWRGLPRAGLPSVPRGGDVSGGRGAGQSTTTIQINKIEVNAPNATDADGVAAGIRGAMERQNFGASANYGQN